MSHHWENPEPGRFLDPRPASNNLLAALQAAGAYPLGKLNPSDLGRFAYTLQAHPAEQIVTMMLDKSMGCLGFTIEETEALIQGLTERLWELRGIKP